jgi:hydroxymethylpyrimidine pyrophosphatase-like HAD family hydrolase
MKFRAFALDYDGTIAQDGVLNPAVKSAVQDVRTSGATVVLVTGRILRELAHYLGDLGLFDAVVAENGASVCFPNGYSRVLGQAPPPTFLDELRRKRVEFTLGHCVVESQAQYAPQILSTIRELELPLVLLFNRSRLMVLPQGVSKSAGLSEALSALRVSVHNTIAVGDAENDHDLLSSCEIGVAVSWGSPALRKMADYVLQGEGPDAVARFMRETMASSRLDPFRITRRRLSLGKTEDGRPLATAIRGRNALISGDIRSGKSWLTGLACEQLILQGYSVCVIDPEGDYQTLEPLPGVVLFGGEDPLPQLPDVARTLRHPDMSVVLDLSHVSHEEKVNYVDTLLPMLAAFRRRTGLPHRIVIDEAHYFLRADSSSGLLDLKLGAYTLTTFRVSDLNCAIRKEIEMIFVKCTTEDRELRALMGIPNSGITQHTAPLLAHLELNQAVLLPPADEAEGQPRLFELLPRLTTHVRHKAKYLDLELINEQAFVFTQNGRPVGRPARTLKDFVESLRTVPRSVLDHHVQRGDFSRWIQFIFHDHFLASAVRKIEQRYRFGHTNDLYSAIAQVIEERYEFS